MAHDVFLSHSSKDKRAADAACAVLEQHGVRCWVAPRDVPPGMEWGGAILRGIESCRVMVIVFSQHANTSPQVRREVERAVAKGAIVIPFRIENVVPTDAMEYFMSSTHWLDAFTPPLQVHLEKLADTILGFLGREPARAVAMTAVAPTASTAAPRPAPHAAAAALWPAELELAETAAAKAAQAANAFDMQVVLGEATGLYGNGHGTLKAKVARTFFDRLNVEACQPAFSASSVDQLQNFLTHLERVSGALGRPIPAALEALKAAAAAAALAPQK